MNMKTIGVIMMLTSMLGAAEARGAKAGDPAPDFQVQDQDGKTVKLSDFRGKSVLLYFYPKDDTPGCTIEAGNFRDDHPGFERLNAVIFGVSRQSADSHREFRDKYHLPFRLLVDSDGALAKQFGVELMPLIGLHKRQSVLIDPKGNIVKFYPNVDPKTHSVEVREDIEKINGSN